MSKLDSTSVSLGYPAASTFDTSTDSGQRCGTARRLIVLVPEFEVDTALVAQKIRELASSLEGCVQIIGLSKDAAHEPSLRRQLVALSAMVRDQHVSVESKIELGSNWLNAVKSEWHERDVIACFAEQRTGLVRRPLNQILESNLNATVYVLGGVHPREKRLRSTWTSSAMAWTGSIVLILLFFWLQLKLTQFPQDWAHTSWLYISIFAEAGTIWLWNSLCG